MHEINKLIKLFVIVYFENITIVHDFKFNIINDKNAFFYAIKYILQIMCYPHHERIQMVSFIAKNKFLLHSYLH